MATTGTAMTDSFSQPPLMSHQHLRPSWRWPGVNARESAHRIAIHAGPRTCHALCLCNTQCENDADTHYNNRESDDDSDGKCSLLYNERYNLISLNQRNICELKEIQIIDVFDRSNISHALFHTVVEKTFLSKDVWFIPQLLYLVCIGTHSKLSHWVPWPHVCLDTKIMCLVWLEAEILPDFRKKIVAILKIQDGGHRELGKKI